MNADDGRLNFSCASTTNKNLFMSVHKMVLEEKEKKLPTHPPLLIYNGMENIH